MRFSRVTRMLLVSLGLAAAMLCFGISMPASSATSANARQGCNSISAFPSPAFIPAQGGDSTLTVAANCTWGVISSSDFILARANVQSGSLDFRVANNPGPARIGYIMIGDSNATFVAEIRQAGVPTVPLYRYWNPSMYNHFYTTDFGELGNGAAGYQYEGEHCRVFATQVAGSVPLYRYYSAGTGDHFYTTDFGELGNGAAGYQFEKIECYVHSSQVTGTTPLYRYYEPNAIDHFYTIDFNELRNGAMGWYLERTQCYVYPPQ